ncbi:hypothetical protein DH2020_013074 [Rehmannia glutinosa]|uniref:SWIM-type domain-containing protein n=1 Tax=Rehmannia glutinosa TaxID=99300 RepID=A0ABR0X515_REHGL
MEALQKYNQGTVVECLHKDPNVLGMKTLKYVFWAFKPCIDAFQYCRLVISVDGTYLYTKYRYKMLTVVTLDANQRVLPLAYAIVDEGTFNSWNWFLQMLSTYVIRGREDVCFISDRHPGIIRSVERMAEFQPPNAHHHFCVRHVVSNFHSRYKNVTLKDLCWQAGAHVRIRTFEKIMEEIKKYSEDTHSYLDAIDKTKWTLSHDDGRRYGILTTNISECMNSVLKGARRLPISALVRFTLTRTAKCLYKRMEDVAMAMESKKMWPDEILQKYHKQQRLALNHSVQMYDFQTQTTSVITIAPGKSRVRTFRVKLSAQECSCRQWKSDGIPCSHAMQACKYVNIDPTNFMKSYYSTSTYTG